MPAKKSNNAELPNRPSWDQYFLDIARVVATRSTCFRRKVGAVIVRNKKIVSTGYNGAPKYQRNCAEIGNCYRQDHNITSFTSLEKCRAVGSHAESNAICLAAKDGTATDNSTIYIYGHTDICGQCRAMIANSGIVRALIMTPEGQITDFDVAKWNTHEIDKENGEKERI
jgi:dCMP deaminase